MLRITATTDKRGIVVTNDQASAAHLSDQEVRPFNSQANQTVSKLLPGKTIGRTCMTVFLKLFQFTLSLTDSPEVGHRGRESIYTKQAESLIGDTNSVKQNLL